MAPPPARAGRAVRRPGAVATAVVVVTASLALTSPAAVAAPAAGGPADGARGGAPGDLVSVERSGFRTSPNAPSSTAAWKIRYRSTDARGRPNIVSGTVIVPSATPRDRPAGPRPLVSYAVGTVGMGDQCAPSRTFPRGKAVEAPLINGALARGWAVAVTDYEGLGTPGDHTYTVGSAEGHAVLDAARAAQRLPQAQQSGVSSTSPVGLMGYSQGGQASGWAAELHRAYAPELDVRGTASGGVPADLAQLVEDNDGGDDAGLVLMAALGHDAAFPSLKLHSYLNDEGRRLATYMRTHCVADSTEAGAGKRMADLTEGAPLDRPEWQRSLRADLLGTKGPDHPVYVYHGTGDELIPSELGERLRDSWCARGVAVRWQTYPKQKHFATAFMGSGPAMNWLAKRFAGLPADDNCR
ncbi:lipase family protein [Streptomyces sp. HNM0574]|uniref:lipase family protein n=1 Tax=Streptomyces sp. HNM0574 TaxID=2714954 RepID=UPI00321737BF